MRGENEGEREFTRKAKTVMVIAVIPVSVKPDRNKTLFPFTRMHIEGISGGLAPAPTPNHATLAV